MKTLRPYQIEGRDALFSARRGILQIAAGGGKTAAGVGAITKALKTAKRVIRVLWIANTIEQVTQAREEMEEQWDDPAAPLRPMVDCSVFCADEAIPAKLDLPSVDILVMDECHRAGAKMWRDIIDGCVNACRVWGLTATPDRADDIDITQIIGPIVYRITRQELEAIGKLVAARVKWIPGGPARSLDEHIRQEVEKLKPEIIRKNAWRLKQLGTDGAAREVRELLNREVWTRAKKMGITENSARNADCARLAVSGARSGSSVLLLVATKAQAADIMTGIPEGMAFFLHSGVATKKRAATIAAFKAGDLPILAATSLADEGMDCPRANFLVLASGGGSPRLAEQRTGRVTRLFEGKSEGLIYDFWDHQHGMTLAHSMKRSGVYQGLGYTVEAPPRAEKFQKLERQGAFL